MADNTVINEGTGGDIIASDDIGGVKYQRVKISQGADGAATDVSSAAPLNVTLANTGANATAVKVDGSAVTQPISHAALTELAGAIDTEVQVDVVTSALPSGAATSAKQDTQITAEQAIQTSVELIDDVIRAEDVASADAHKGAVIMAVRQDTPANTSGTDGDYETPKMSGGRLWVDASGKTLTVDGSGVTQPVSNAGLTELAAAINSSKVDVNIVSSDVATGGTSAADDADFTDGTTPGTPAMGVYESTPTTVTDGDLGVVGITEDRQLKVKHTDSIAVTNAGLTELAAAIDTEVQVDVVGALPAGNNNIGDVDVASIAAGDNNIGNVDIVTLPVAFNTGTRSATTQRVTIATDDVVPASQSGTWNIGTVTAVTAISNALPAGTNAIGKLAANSGVDIGDVDVTSIAAGTNAIGNVGLIGRTSGGLTIFRSIDIDETEEEIKATAGQLFSITAFNRTAAPLYLKFYNATAANVTVGTTTPVLTFVVPANADSDGAGFVWNNEIGFAFGTAMTVACTTAVADNDTGAPGANDCIINIGYM